MARLGGIIFVCVGGWGGGRLGMARLGVEVGDGVK